MKTNKKRNNQDRRKIKRILVLGSAPHTRLVTAYTWDKLPRDLNVADYDVVILNLTPFFNEQFARGMNLEMLPSFQQFARLIFSEGSEIIAIGLPGMKIGNGPYRETTWWLPPRIPAFVFDSGEEIRDIQSEFAYYFPHVRHWFFHATSALTLQYPDETSYASVIDPQAIRAEPTLLSIAQTRFQQPVAFELQFRPMEVERMNLSGLREIKQSGRVFWLPPTTEISTYEAIDLILRERYRIRFEQAPPAWVERYKLPRQLPIEESITLHKQGILRLEKQLVEAQHQLHGATRFRKLLYEQGEDVLEPVVRDALRELGAQVYDPQRRGREDGRLIDPAGRKGMLEIKGRTGALRLQDVRELDHWVRDAVADEDWNSKGIFVANMRCGDPPELRGDQFPPNCVKALEQFGLCLLTTTQLFRALYSYQRKELDLDAFWSSLFSTNGICSLPELDIEFISRITSA